MSLSLREKDRALRTSKLALTIHTELHRRLPFLLARDTEGPGRDGFAGGGYREGGRSYDPRPTEATAITLADHGELADPYHAEMQVLLGHLRDSAEAAAAAKVSLAKLDRLSKGDPGHLLNCVNPHCGAVITRVGNDRPRRGRCRRCFTFLEEHDRDWTPTVEREAKAS